MASNKPTTGTVTGSTGSAKKIDMEVLKSIFARWDRLVEMKSHSVLMLREVKHHVKKLSLVELRILARMAYTRLLEMHDDFKVELYEILCSFLESTIQENSGLKWNPSSGVIALPRSQVHELSRHESLLWLLQFQKKSNAEELIATYMNHLHTKFGAHYIQDLCKEIMADTPKLCSIPGTELFALYEQINHIASGEFPPPEILKLHVESVVIVRDESRMEEDRHYLKGMESQVAKKFQDFLEVAYEHYGAMYLGDLQSFLQRDITTDQDATNEGAKKCYPLVKGIESFIHQKHQSGGSGPRGAGGSAGSSGARQKRKRKGYFAPVMSSTPTGAAAKRLKTKRKR